MIKQKHVGTLRSIVTRSYERKRLFMFTVHWPRGYSMPSELTLAWETESVGIGSAPAVGIAFADPDS